ncbi:MAG: shikimate transporter [Alphaproteobacteria bacterium]|nr:MAG: shikimate transporter [Alphaproteobacteria bacterium]
MTMERTASGKSTLKVAVTASAGAAIEWYDFFIYGTAAALVFPQLFFPADLPPFVAQIAAFSTFAVGFIARPIGGVVFGHIGDIVGRKHALAAALLIMGVSTTAIGLLPGYADIGVAAPLALVALRFIQGLAIGGQWGGAALMAIENAPDGKRGFYGSFVQIGVPVGVVLANVAFFLVGAFVSPADFSAWGWRLPFLLSIALIFIGFYVQFRLEEPSAARSAPNAGEGSVLKKQGWPLLKVLRAHWRDVLLAGGAFIANNTCFYVAITYVVAYGASTLGLSRQTMLAAVMIGSICMIPVLIMCGAISDRIGRKGIFMTGAALTGLWAFAIFPLIETGSFVNITLAVSVALVLISLMYGPQAALFAELFPAEVRYSGASLGYQIGTVFGGGLAPIIATLLLAQFQSSHAIAVYLAVMCVISFLSTMFLGGRSARSPAHA